MPETVETTAPEPLAVRAYKVGPLIGAGPTTVAKLIKEGTLESVRVGRARCVTMRSIKRLLHSEAA